MKSRWGVILVGLCVAICVLSLIGPALRNEGPRYAGRSLSDWLSRYHRDVANPWPHKPDGTTVESREAASAVRKIGTKALPWLLKWARCEAGNSERLRFVNLLKQHLQPGGFLAASVDSVLTPQPVIDAERAFDGFRILGSDAGVALPQLTSLIQDTNAPETASRCKMMMACVGEAGLGPLLAAVTNRDSFQREHAIAAIYMFMSPTNLVPAVPMLAELIKAGPCSLDATYALKMIGHYPETAFCVLTNSICTGNRQVQLQALWTLQRKRQLCPDAGPYLRRCANDSDPLIKECSLRALESLSRGENKPKD